MSVFTGEPYGRLAVMLNTLSSLNIEIIIIIIIIVRMTFAKPLDAIFDVSFSPDCLTCTYMQMILGSGYCSRVTTFWETAAPSANHMFLCRVGVLFSLLPVLVSGSVFWF